MQVLVFDLRGEIAHFRRPDTMGTQATYPFITRTALRGLIGSILGRESLPPEVRCGIRLLASVRTVAQELTMHGKSWASGGAESSFHRPTSIELLVKPHYRIYYAGPMIDELSRRIKAGLSHYHTYLGSAYCLTVPQWVDETDMELLEREDADGPVCCVTVVPEKALTRLVHLEGREYARVGGVLWEHIGERRFRGSVSILYEVNGRPIHFHPRSRDVDDAFWGLVRISQEETMCLW